MKVKFNNKEYIKKGRKGTALKYLCFDIFKKYLILNNNYTYKELQDTFNQWHCNNNFVVLSKYDWENKTEDLKKRYFSPIQYNNENIYFTTQWGNNGADCDNINNMIDFAKEQGYDIEIINKEVDKRNSINIKNIILYGAPGVGKTHNYKNLISMIEDGKNQNEIFSVISKNDKVDLDNETFETIKNEKRVEFVTFHQSYSYEDFIEGFRPNKSGNIELEDGVFKIISDNSKRNLEDSQKSKNEIENQYTYTNLFSEFKLYVEDKLSSDGVFYLKGKATITDIGKSSFLVGGSVSSGQNLAFNIIERDYDDFKNDNIQNYKDIKSTFESKSGIHGNAPYYFALYKKLKEFENNAFDNSNKINIEQVAQKNYYLVIDEINRGNISKIFGELITLIEEDKRDVYKVTLPYSKEKFKVPSNLYIIATMNSTDKSIATIDIALRRRFTFLKMKPNENLINFADAKKLFNNLNTFIEAELSEDYKLGHSYFMKVENKEDLEFVKEYKIKPLLEEYFYADDEKYEEVLKILNNNETQKAEND
jgi:5-methylcytosine-specific restriction protein B